MFGISNNESVLNTSWEGNTFGVFNVDDIKRSRVSVNIGQLSNTSDVVTTLNVNSGPQINRINFGDLIFLQVQFNWISDFNCGIRITESASIMSNNIRNFVGSNRSGFDFTKFEFSFFSFQFLKNKSSLGIYQDSEVFFGLINGNNVH